MSTLNLEKQDNTLLMIMESKIIIIMLTGHVILDKHVNASKCHFSLVIKWEYIFGFL